LYSALYKNRLPVGLPDNSAKFFLKFNPISKKCREGWSNLAKFHFEKRMKHDYILESEKQRSNFDAILRSLTTIEIQSLSLPYKAYQNSQEFLDSRVKTTRSKHSCFTCSEHQSKQTNSRVPSQRHHTKVELRWLSPSRGRLLTRSVCFLPFAARHRRKEADKKCGGAEKSVESLCGWQVEKKITNA
jgi:hypothetical protein